MGHDNSDAFRDKLMDDFIETRPSGKSPESAGSVFLVTVRYADAVKEMACRTRERADRVRAQFREVERRDDHVSIREVPLA